MAVALMQFVVGTVLVAFAAEPPEAGGEDEIIRPALILTPAQAQDVAELRQNAAIETTDELLLALERSGEDLRTFQAKIIYTKLFPFEGDEQERTGRLYYVVEQAALDADSDGGDEAGQEPRRTFAVHFDTLRFDDRIERGEDRSFVFDGQWLVEKLHKERQMFRRQVVPPGERFDPLRLGEGPFPIPIGQKREQILERFEAELLATDAGIEMLDSDVADWLTSEHYPTYQLRLTPRAEFADELDLAEIRIWYLKRDLLPRAAWTRAVNGNESTIQLLGQIKNGEVAAEMMDTSVPRTGWDVETTEWRGSLGGTP